jgi:nucleoside-diphosphate-sugar epimerase
MKTHTYFVSGGCGFLGQYVVKAIHDFDPFGKIRVLDIYPRPTLLGIESLARVEIIKGDLLQPDSFLSELHGLNTIVHCASVISFRGGGEDARLSVNIYGTRNLLRAAIDNGCQDFIFISSISAVDCRPGQISDETMVPNLEKKRLTDPYGYSKLLSERAIAAESDRIRGIILNPSVILGPGSPLIERVLHWLRWVPFCPMTTNMNSFVDVRDVAQAVVLALKQGRSGERYIVTAENLDNLTFLALVLKEMGKKAPVFPIPEGLFSPYDFLTELLDSLGLVENVKKSSQIVVDKAYCNGKIRREMGWQPAFTVEESLRNLISTTREIDEARGQDSLAYGSL